jgi:hypothetical protein
MSSPNRDDEPATPVTAASPLPGDEERQDETLRLQEEVIAAAQKLEQQSIERETLERESFGRELLDRLSSERDIRGMRQDLVFRERTPLPLQTVRQKFEVAQLRPRESRSLQQSPRGLWQPTLDPISMPPPPQEKFGLPITGVLVGLFGAIGIAAAIALVVVRTIPFGPPSPGLYAEPGTGKNRSFAAVADNLPRLGTAETKVPQAEMAAAAAAASVLVAPPSAALAKPSVMTPPPAPTVEAAAKPEPAKPEPVQAEPAKPEPVKPSSIIPEPRPAGSLSNDEIASLLKRGQDLIAAGDIASGRLMLTRAAQAGNADASLALAGTFDVAVLANLRAVGVQPDAAKARAWYTRAAEQGSVEAKQRLQALR